ncbi:hypothetical protein C8Q73DRAFT_796294 [Cubamyces lactineus]|nr:hypothetical protein C8Q73DRAFT_796294 [Cubamyces lactineus]
MSSQRTMRNITTSGERPAKRARTAQNGQPVQPETTPADASSLEQSPSNNSTLSDLDHSAASMTTASHGGPTTNAAANAVIAPATICSSKSSASPSSVVADNTSAHVQHAEAQAATLISTSATITTASVELSLPAWVPETVVRRLPGMLAFEDPKCDRWAVSRLPRSGSWGGNKNTRDLARYYCVDDKPATFFFVGFVSFKSFTDDFGQPLRRVKIGLNLLRSDDMVIAAEFLSRTRPHTSLLVDKVYASRSMSEWGKEERAKVIPFNNVFDARKGYGPKSSMARMTTQDFGRGDLILMEAALTRFRPVGRYTWDEWKTSFELRAISLLAEIPDNTHIDNGAEFDADGDVCL